MRYGLTGTRSSGGQRLLVAKDERGNRVDIDDLSALKRKGDPRPRCLCLVCDRLLVARLGEKRRHHFGHKPVSAAERCWATSPEGEIHLSAKRRVELVLRQACDDSKTVKARIRCPMCSGLADHPDVVTLSPTHKVVIESWAEPTRSIKPDVQVVDATGKPVLFIEVRVTHGNDDAKVRFVRSTGVPLLEVAGQQTLDELTEPDFECLQSLNVRTQPFCAVCVRREEELRVEAARREAARTALDELLHRRNAVRSEAERRVRERWYFEERSELVSWCHVHVFCGAELRKTAVLDVEATWVEDVTRLRLRLRGQMLPVGEWVGSISDLRRIYRTELHREARAVARKMRDESGPGAAVETFSGFWTRGFENRPPMYTRIQDSGTGEWMTMYPWHSLARRIGHAHLSSLVREHHWRVARCERGKAHVEAQGFDAFLRARRSLPWLQRRPLRDDWRWKIQVESEIDRLLSRSGVSEPCRYLSS